MAPSGPTGSRYQPKAHVELAPGDGPQTAYVQLRDSAGDLSPVGSDSIILDTTPPQLDLGSVLFTPGQVGSGAAVPVVLAWSAQDATSGVAQAELDRTCPASGSEVLARLDHGTSATTQPLWLTPGTACRLYLSAADIAGSSAGLTALEPTLTSKGDAPSAALAYSGPWTTRRSPLYLGGVTHSAAKRGASATISFTGTDLAFVASYGPDRGRASVLVDGVRVAVVDLYRPQRAYRQIVFVQHLSGGPHVMTVRVLGTHDTASTAARVDVDAFLTMDGGIVATPTLAGAHGTGHHSSLPEPVRDRADRKLPRPSPVAGSTSGGDR